jgi:hypothetical protein
VPEKVAHKLFQYCYPPGPHWNARDCKVLGGALSATVLSVSDTETRVRLAGKLELAFPSPANGNDRTDAGPAGRVTARLTGVVRYSPSRRVITSWVMASEEAEYVRYWKGQAMPAKMLIAVQREP